MSSRALGARPVAARGLPALPATPPAAGRPARPWLVVAEPHACTHVRTHAHTHQQRASVAGRCPPSPGPRVGVTLRVVLSNAHSPPLVRLLLGPPPTTARTHTVLNTHTPPFQVTSTHRNHTWQGVCSSAVLGQAFSGCRAQPGADPRSVRLTPGARPALPSDPVATAGRARGRGTGCCTRPSQLHPHFSLLKGDPSVGRGGPQPR